MIFIKRILNNLLITITTVFAMTSFTASANSEPFLGEIQVMGNNFCPSGWTNAAGQLLPINQNQALFALLGTTYGGDGRTTFALPDYRSRISVGIGSGGNNIGSISLGERNGREAISGNLIPSHTHTATTVTMLNASSGRGKISVPTNAVLADDGADNIYNAEIPNVNLSSQAIASSTVIGAASNTAIDNMQPYQVLTVCIALEGLFPSRN
jgi:microcystin-dependent protein